MLDGMRKASQGLVGRAIMAVVMGFIILSFAIWGIGDIFSGFGANKVASVGAQDITADQVRYAYQTQLQNLQQQYRRAITNDQARAIGLDTQVLGRLVAEASLDQKAQKLGLAISDAEMAKAIQNDPNFAGPTGKFDFNRFNDILRNNGLNEQGFLRDQRKVYLRQEISSSLIGGLEAPQAALEAVNRYRNETRAIEYVTLPEGAVGEIPAPAPEDLQSYFDQRKQTYRTDETRKITLLSVTPESLADSSKVSDADARARYESVKGGRFGAAETRHLQQIVFPSEQEAAEASQKIKEGASFDSVAADRKLTDKDIDLGTVAKSDMIDQTVAAAAFSLPQGAVSDPIKGQFGVVLVRVEEIKPESVKPYEEVAADLKMEIATERARTTAQNVRNKIEDERTSGQDLAQAAKAAGLETRVIEAVTATGLDGNGNPIVDLPERDTLLKAIFASDVGVDNDVVQTREGGFAWFEIASVNPARERTLDEVRADVEKGWREDEITKRLSAKAEEIVAKLKTGATIEAVAKDEGDLEVKQASDVKRIGTGSVPPGVIARVFALSVGDVGSAAGEGLSRIVFKINDSVTPPLDPDSDTTKGIADQLRSAFAEELLTQYISKLQADLGVRVNEAAFRNAVGATDPNAPF
jgi:peptidyl-prolyl cis-trans isomerase D